MGSNNNFIHNIGTLVNFNIALTLYILHIKTHKMFYV